MDKLPVFEMVIDENPESEIEVAAIAFVDKPAIEKNFIAFASDFKVGDKVKVIPGKEHDPSHAGMTMEVAEIVNGAIALKMPDGTIHKWYTKDELMPASKAFSFAIDAQRHIISGPAMVPNTLIYRRDQNGEYNVFFSKDTVEAIALKFFKKDYQKNINLFPDPNLSVQGVTVFESFVSDKSRGVMPMGGYEDLPDGTWFISAKVENDAVWQSIKSGQVKGFSVEGYFGTVKSEKPVEEKVFEILNATYNEDGHIYPNVLTMIKEKLKGLLSKFKKEHFDAPVADPAPPIAPTSAPPVVDIKLTDYQTSDGQTISIDRLEVGGKCTMNGQPCPPGTYELADGTSVTVGDGGMISAVTTAQPMQQPITMDQVNQAIQNAIAALKPVADPAIAQMQEQITAQKLVNEKQAKTIQSLFEIVEQIAELPTEEPVIGTRQQFLKKLEETKDEKIHTLAERLQKLKKVQ